MVQIMHFLMILGIVFVLTKLSFDAMILFVVAVYLYQRREKCSTSS
jgi:hypothetical protein